jgi:hypothetical protein
MKFLRLLGREDVDCILKIIGIVMTVAGDLVPEFVSPSDKLDRAA